MSSLERRLSVCAHSMLTLAHRSAVSRLRYACWVEVLVSVRECSLPFAGGPLRGR